ncbi:hypothetical protein SVAN01_08635 [Stagonosporopsis vannaccii]|nr:hypothetical protein SVAN01_08635 [Stagonosporopsis vannaccii]
MAEASLHELNYGRPGLTFYDLDDRKWNTSRRPTSNGLNQVAEWQLAISAAKILSPTETTKNATSTRKHLKQLTQDHTQLVPAAKQLPELTIISEAIESTASTFDPQVGDLLSYGTVFLKKFVRPKRIAALPTGPSGSILRLVPLGQQKLGWKGDKSVWLCGSSFRTVDSGYWNEDAAPIQQVCFAQTESSNSFLAVRLHSKTVLFRPSYHRGRRAADPSRHYDLPPSLLSARPILHLDIGRTGGSPHADVVFNPDYQFQFGIIDQSYRWSLWQIERRAKREEYSVTRMVAGNILAEDDKMDNGDGWARILWAGDSNTLIVCNRRHLSVISVKGEKPEYLDTPPVVPIRSTDWILDIRRHPQHKNHFFVLTSTRIFLIAVTTFDAAINSTAGKAGGTTLLSRRHYRGDEDITLRMYVQGQGTTTYLFMTSCLNKITQVYQVQDDPSPSTESVTTTDPVTLSIDLPTSANVSQMHLQLLRYGTKVVSEHRPRNSSAQLYYQEAVPFYQLTIMLSDMSVFQTVMLFSNYDWKPEPLVWRRAVVVKHSLDAKTEVDEMDGFVEPNGPDWDADPELKLGYQTLRLASFQDRLTLRAKADRTALYDALVDFHADANVSLEALTNQLRQMMNDKPNESPSRYFMESLDTVNVSDVDEESAMVDQLFADDSSQSTNTLYPIADAHVLHLPPTERISIADLYDNVLQDWIASLPAEVAVPVRQAKERLARRIAAEVTLASTYMKPREDEQPTFDPCQSLALPILPSKPADLLLPSLPTPPQSSIPPSSPLLPDFVQLPPRDPLSRLRKHLTITDDTSLTPTVLPPSVSELLLHWQTGTDPTLYNWEATEETLRPEAPDEEGQELRERERKRRERRDKRQRREDELMRAKTQTSNQPMFSQPAHPRSSPGPKFGGMTPSSQVPIPTSSQMASQVYGQAGGFVGFGAVNSTVAQSQVEPGRFGGRPDKKRKKGKSRHFVFTQVPQKNLLVLAIESLAPIAIFPQHISALYALWSNPDYGTGTACVVAMELKPHYVSKDFKRYAHQEFSNQYSIFRTVSKSAFKHKTHLDTDSAARNANVIAVGHYHRWRGGPPV